MQHKLHIVSFDVPYPADYGGAIDVFYKVKALHQLGCQIYLHCYEYGRGTPKELEQYCEKVWYYKRNTGLGGISLSKPYGLSSRNDSALLQRLQETHAPIFFDQLFTTSFLNAPSLRGRFKAIRVHNVEHDYYKLLGQKDTSFFKKLYFNIEAGLIKKYEHQLQAAQAFFALSVEDQKYFKAIYPEAKNQFIPPFHQYDEVNIKPGSGDYCLYHGNLSHPENIEAALYLINNVFPKINMPVVVAGKNPAVSVADACKNLRRCKLVVNPDKERMDILIANAHVHVLPTFQQSGMKLKLLSALYGGRHVVVNKQMLYGTGMAEGLSNLADSSDEFVTTINSLEKIPFTESDIAKRIALLAPYNNIDNAKSLLRAMGLYDL